MMELKDTVEFTIRSGATISYKGETIPIVELKVGITLIEPVLDVRAQLAKSIPANNDQCHLTLPAMGTGQGKVTVGAIVSPVLNPATKERSPTHVHLTKFLQIDSQKLLKHLQTAASRLAK